MFLRIALLAMAAGAPPGDDQRFPALRINDSIEYYPIHGDSVRQIREGLRKLAPSGVQIRHGRTSSSFQVESSYEQGKEDCALTGLEVAVDITVSLPEWRPTPRAPDALREQWSAAITQLTRHEAGHRRHAVEAAQELRDALLRLPPEEDCMRMQLRVDEAIRRATWKLGRRDRFYDRRTDGGLRDDPQPR